MPLSQEEAQRVIAAAQARAAQVGIRVTVAVVDEGGLLLSLSRMDGAPPLSAQIAEAKASGAALWLRDGGGLAQVAQDRPAFFEAGGRRTRPAILPRAGPGIARRGPGGLGGGGGL